MARSVILTGFMATGKTTVGRILSDRLGYPYVDTDRIIVWRAGSIAGIFERRGEEGFRSWERIVARELAGTRRLVIATGGRMMLDPECAAHLEPTGDVVCLTARAETILKRVTGPGITPRPLLGSEDPAARARELLEERTRGYRRFKCVDTESRSAEEVADAVMKVLNITAPSNNSR